MSTDLNLLGKGLIRLGILILLFILTPIILTMSFKAIKKFTESPEIYFAYGLFLISIILLIFTLYFTFKTFKVISNAIFNNYTK
ncbi:DUF6095 family protein [uncultured Polaribacter sp.]|uniref:DUF6095 family protein n=1 Tax=uncultured Polaribacter sp. TaxID=174711 RepID=UPI002609B5A2|nr:DUF6095 family protein [uncultured Polaribacter sp.]